MDSINDEIFVMRRDIEKKLEEVDQKLEALEENKEADIISLLKLVERKLRNRGGSIR